MGYQIVSRSNPQIALGAWKPDPGQNVVRMMPQGTAPIDAIRWDIRPVVFGNTIFGTCLFHRWTGWTLCLDETFETVSLHTNPPFGYANQAWTFSEDKGDYYITMSLTTRDYPNYTLQLDQDNNVVIRPAAGGAPKECWRVIYYDDGGSASDPIGFVSALSGQPALQGNADGSVIATGQPGAAGEKGWADPWYWQLITPFVKGVPLNSQLMRNVAYKTYLHCGGTTQGLNLLSQIPGDHEGWGPGLWMPGRTPVAQGFDIPNPYMDGSLVSIGSGGGVYLYDWRTDDASQLWNFAKWT